MARNLITYLLPLLFIVTSFPSVSADYNVLRYGARSNGRTDSTKSFLRAWAAACRSSNPAKIHVPRGRYLLKQTTFRGPCRNKVIIQIDGTLLAPVNLWALGNSGYWISFNQVTGVSIYGGILDGRGGRFWACRRAGRRCPVGARSIGFNNARNIVVSGLTSLNSQIMHISINNCNNVMIRRVKIIAPANSPNTDGIHIQQSSGLTITNSNIGTGDDCISFGPGTNRVLVDRVGCGPGHGISIGSLAQEQNEQGVEDVTVRNVVFTGSDNGLRIKSWARPSNGFVRGIFYQNIIMNKVKNPIIIDQQYCPDNRGCPGQHSGTSISGVTYQNIRGTSATLVAMNFECSATHPCRGIKLLDVNLIHFSRPAKSLCKNAHGTTNGFVIPGSCL